MITDQCFYKSKMLKENPNKRRYGFISFSLFTFSTHSSDDIFLLRWLKKVTCANFFLLSIFSSNDQTHKFRAHFFTFLCQIVWIKIDANRKKNRTWNKVCIEKRKSILKLDAVIWNLNRSNIFGRSMLIMDATTVSIYQKSQR